MSRLFLLLALASAVTAARKRPHIILVVADDLGYGDVGFRGSEIKTPVIDNLANKQGRVLENYYVLSSCSPTRSAIHTGRYPMRFNMDVAMLGGLPRGVPLNETFLPQVLKQEGYHTHAVGKWHLGAHAWEFTPTFRGYDTYLGYLQGGESYWTHQVPWFIPHFLDNTSFPLINQYDFRRQTKPNCGKDCSTLELGANNHYSTHLLTAEATRIIDTHKASEPLFLYLAYQAVHGPTEAPDSYVAPYLHIKNRMRRVYAGMLAALDEGVGNVTRALKYNGLWNNTIMIFTTDNGGPTDTCDPQGSFNGPLRGGKCWLTEGGTRGTAFVSGGLLAPEVLGKPVPNLMHAVDWLPTLASLAGASGPGTALPLDGVNQRQGLMMVSSNEAREDVFIGFSDSGHTGSALRMGRWKLLRGPPHLTGWQYVAGRLLGPLINDIKTNNYTIEDLTKLSNIIDKEILDKDSDAVSRDLLSRYYSNISWPWFKRSNEQLFDVTTDIAEEHDVSKQHPDVVTELRGRLDAYGAQAPPKGTDPALSPECKAQKPPKHSNLDGPGGMPAVVPYCSLLTTSNVFV